MAILTPDLASDNPETVPAEAEKVFDKERMSLLVMRAQELSGPIVASVEMKRYRVLEDSSKEDSPNAPKKTQVYDLGAMITWMAGQGLVDAGEAISAMSYIESLGKLITDNYPDYAATLKGDI